MIFLVNLAATLFLTGLAWSMQVVQLRVLRPDQLPLHRTLNTRLMIAPMAIEFVTAAWLAIVRPTPLLIAALVLWIVVAYVTLRYSLLRHEPRQEAIIGRMRGWNLARTLAWSARSVLLLCILSSDARI